MITATSFKRYFVSIAAVALAAGSPGGPAWADPFNASETVHLTIDEDTLGASLHAFGKQSGAQILFSETSVSGRAGVRLDGTYTAAAALEALLNGTDLEAVRGQGNTFIIRHRNNQKKETLKEPDLPRRVSDTPAVASDAEADASSPEPLMVDKIIVTGTSLRGITPESSPLQVYSRDDILGSGVTTTEQFIRTLPQNFGGGSTELAPSGLPGDSNSQFNNIFGSGANLRGLGSGGTLTLLNGNRLAPTSEIGDFVDLSLIPISALERVDVMTDGASSIYGGDAVAGVMNFVLRDDFEGAETAVRYGAVTQGNLEEYRLSQTLGTAWQSGNVIATYEYFDRDNLSLADRPDIPVPTQTDGAPISNVGLFDLLPQQTRQSGLLSLRQSVNADLDVSVSGLYSKRKADSLSVYASNTSSVLGFEASSELQSLSASATYAITPRWAATFDSTYSNIHNIETAQTLLPEPFEPSVKVTHSDLYSADLRLNGDLWRIGGGTVKSALGVHVRRETFVNEQRGEGAERDGERDVSAVYGELLVPFFGSGNAVPGIQRLELNVSGRLDDYSDFGSTVNPKIGALWSPVSGLIARGSYSESFAPPPLGRTGDLNRVAAVVPYSFILGLLGGIPAPDPSLEGVDYLQTSGTIADLEPETSRTYTAGIDFTRHMGRHDWSVRTNYYDIAFEGRLGSTPIPQNLPAVLAPSIAFNDPDAFPDGTIIFFPSAAELDALEASLSQPVIFLGGGNSLDNVGIINNSAVVRNLASTRTSGVDLQVDYATETDWGKISAGINANHILDFTQQASPTTPEVVVLDTYLNPVDLQLRAHVGVSVGGLAGNVFVNYADSYKTDETDTAAPIAAWTTIDTSLSYALGQRQNPWLDGTTFNLSVTNLLDQSPPHTPSVGTSRIAGFDPANASPLGRFVAIEIRKAF